MPSVTRADIEAAIEEEYNYALLDRANATSTVLSAFGTVPMGSRVQNLPALATRPKAKWVGHEEGERTKPTAKFTFENKMLTAAEVAVIILLNEEDLEDATDDLLAKATNLGGEAIGTALDEAVLFGVNKPALWTAPDLFASATAAGAIQQVGTGDNDLVGSIFKAAEKVDTAGGNPSAFISRQGLKFRLANLRNNDNTPIYVPSLSATPGSVDSVAGMTAHWNQNGAFDRTKAEGLVVDPTGVLIGQRSDITVKFLDQATVDGINLAENDKVGLRFRARYAYTLADVIGTDGQRLAPAAAVTPAAAAGGGGE